MCFFCVFLHVWQPGNFGAPGDPYPMNNNDLTAEVAGYNNSGKNLSGNNNHTVNSTNTTSMSASNTSPKSQDFSGDKGTGGSSGGYGNGPSASSSSGPGSGPTSGGGGGEFKPLPQGQPKRLHVSNIPFRFREPDLRQLFYVS